jgi:hypothetical protein
LEEDERERFWLLNLPSLSRLWLELDEEEGLDFFMIELLFSG